MIKQTYSPTWIYLIKSKSEIFEVFQRFNALVIRQSDMKIKVLRTDGAGEFVSTDYKKFCDEEGTSHEITPLTHPNIMSQLKGRTRA